MGGISKFTGGIVNTATGGLVNYGAGNEAAAAAQHGADTQAQYEQQALDYLKQENKMPDHAREMLAQLMMGGQDSQTALDKLKQSPLYQAILSTGAQGQEAVAKQAALTGGLRSGLANEALYNQDQQLKQHALMSSLGGLSGLAGTNFAPQIAGTMGQIGQTYGQGIIGSEGSRRAANQQQLGNILKIGEMAAMMSDIRLKDNVTYIRYENGHKIYMWTWNDIAKEMFGLVGDSHGVIAQEVEKIAPHAVSTHKGYKSVNYTKIGVEHG